MKSVFPNDSIDPVTSLMEDSKAPHFPTPKGPSLVAQRVKNPPMMQETWVQSLGWADPLEKGMVIHSSILAWRISWTEKPGRLQSIGSQRVGHD